MQAIQGTIRYAAAPHIPTSRLANPAPLLALFSLACIILIHAARAQETTPATLPAATTSVESTNDTETFADFESSTYDGWTLDGDAFGTAPATDALFPGQITGFRGRDFLCSLHPKKGNSATGKATSRDFTIEKPVIRFKIGGGNHPNEACLNLVVDNQIVRTATGDDLPTLSDASWDVSALIGKKAHLEVVDSSTSAERGYILVDDIRFTGRIDFDNLPYQATVKQMADSWISKYHLPGVWCAYIKDGKVVADVADGVKNIETKTPASIGDHLNIGSVSKVVTDSLISFFVANGTIKYETTVEEVFPELAKQYPPSPLLKATLRQLMTHTAGLMHDVAYGSDKMGGIAWRYAQLKLAINAPGLTEPGTVYAYSNIGPIIAVSMVERLSKTSYEQWLYGELGKRIGLVSPWMLDYSISPSADDIFPHYLDDNSASVNHLVRPDSWKYAPEGSCRLTLADLSAFLIFTMTNSAHLPDTVFQELTKVNNHGNPTVYNTTSGGWGTEHGTLHHSGDTGRGEYCMVVLNVQEGNGFIFYTNAGYRKGQAPTLNGGMNPELSDMQKLTGL